MIVKCEQCQTRFKIPDEKVTDKGVKVRCNKCGHTFRVTRDMAQPSAPSQQLPPVPPPALPADPFARFGAPKEEPPPGEVTRPGVFTLGVEASRNPELGNKKPAPSFNFSELAPPSVPSLGSAPPPPPPPFPAAAAPPKPAPAFDFSAVAPPAASSAATAQAPAFDFSAIAPPSASSAPTTQAPAFDFSAFASPGAAPAAPAPAAFDFAALGAPTTPDAPTAAQAFDFSAPPEPQAPPPPARDEKTQVARPFGNDGFLGGGDPGPSPTLPSFDGATARAMFDMPAPSSSALPELPPPEPEDFSPPPAAPAPAKQSVPTMPAAPSPELLAASEKPRSRRGVVGIIVNIAIAALLVLGLVVVGSAYLNDGKVSAESLSVEQLKNTFAPSVPFVASDVTNGLYDTRAGRAVFYVRGEVANRSDAPATLVVKAEIIENGKVVRAAEAFVTEQPPTVEELYAVDGTDALEALQRRVEKRAAAVAPGGTASFVVAFTEYPPDLKGFRVRVSARPVTAPTATR